MHKLLSDLLRKRKLTVSELTSEEKEEFKRWQTVLDDEVTVEKIVEFCNIQMDRIEAQWADLDAKKLKNERLIIMHAVYKKIVMMIEGKKTERQSIEDELNRLLDT